MKFETSHTDVEDRLLAGVLAPGCRVLEAGCGRTTRLAAHRDRIERLAGVDIDAGAIAENPAIDEPVVGDLCRPLPFGDASFDLVYANFVIEHLRWPARAFSEWRRVLTDGGAVVLLTSNAANPVLATAARLPMRARLAIKRAGAGAAERDVIPVHYAANTPGRLDLLLRSSGFAPVEVVYVATLHRYAERAPAVAGLLVAAERALPSRLRSTIVALYSAV